MGLIFLSNPVLWIIRFIRKKHMKYNQLVILLMIILH